MFPGESAPKKLNPESALKQAARSVTEETGLMPVYERFIEAAIRKIQQGNQEEARDLIRRKLTVDKNTTSLEKIKQSIDKAIKTLPNEVLTEATEENLAEESPEQETTKKLSGKEKKAKEKKKKEEKKKQHAKKVSELTEGKEEEGDEVEGGKEQTIISVRYKAASVPQPEKVNNSEEVEQDDTIEDMNMEKNHPINPDNNTGGNQEEKPTSVEKDYAAIASKEFNKNITDAFIVLEGKNWDETKLESTKKFLKDPTASIVNELVSHLKTAFPGIESYSLKEIEEKLKKEDALSDEHRQKLEVLKYHVQHNEKNNRIRKELSKKKNKEISETTFKKGDTVSWEDGEWEIHSFKENTFWLVNEKGDEVYVDRVELLGEMLEEKKLGEVARDAEKLFANIPEWEEENKELKQLREKVRKAAKRVDDSKEDKKERTTAEEQLEENIEQYEEKKNELGADAALLHAKEKAEKIKKELEPKTENKAEEQRINEVIKEYTEIRKRFSETQTWKNKKGEILVDKQLEKIRKHIVESIDDLLSNIKTYKKKRLLVHEDQMKDLIQNQIKQHEEQERKIEKSGLVEKVTKEEEKGPAVENKEPENKPEEKKESREDELRRINAEKVVEIQKNNERIAEIDAKLAALSAEEAEIERELLEIEKEELEIERTARERVINERYKYPAAPDEILNTQIEDETLFSKDTLLNKKNKELWENVATEQQKNEYIDRFLEAQHIDIDSLDRKTREEMLEVIDDELNWVKNMLENEKYRGHRYTDEEAAEKRKTLNNAIYARYTSMNSGLEIITDKAVDKDLAKRSPSAN